MLVFAFVDSLKRKTIAYHAQVPLLKKLPAPVIGIILALALFNAIIWAAVGVVLVSGADQKLSNEGEN
jgi:hypothetical protein